MEEYRSGSARVSVKPYQTSTEVSNVPVSVSFFIFGPANSSSEDTVIVPTSIWRTCGCKCIDE